MITPFEVNPYAPDPASTASGLYVTGGGADGQVTDVVAWLVERVVRDPAISVQLSAPDQSGRAFDFAETIAFAVTMCGGQYRLPDTATQLRAACIRHRTMLRHVEQARTVKGALLFGSGLCAVVLDHHDRVITYDPGVGLVAVGADQWSWQYAARIPGLRGYR